MAVLTVEAEITGDGRLLVELPPDAPRGKVVLTLEVPPEDDLELADEDLRGLGLTAEEIAAAPEIGVLAEDPQVPSGAEFVERLRAAKPRYRW